MFQASWSLGGGTNNISTYLFVLIHVDILYNPGGFHQHLQSFLSQAWCHSNSAGGCVGLALLYWGNVEKQRNHLFLLWLLCSRLNTNRPTSFVPVKLFVSYVISHACGCLCLTYLMNSWRDFPQLAIYVPWAITAWISLLVISWGLKITTPQPNLTRSQSSSSSICLRNVFFNITSLNGPSAPPPCQHWFN